MSKRVANLVVETLQAAGVETCYGIVGDTMNRIAHAIDRSEIDWVHVRHEETGALAAAAEASLTGRLTACAGTCGPGSLHFINGLYADRRTAGDARHIWGRRRAGEIRDLAKTNFWQ
jgi:pyruvate dehydrogenase (quinone)